MKTKICTRGREGFFAGGAKRRSSPLPSLPCSSSSPKFLVVVLELAPVGPAGLPERPDLLLGHVLARLLERLPVEVAELLEALWMIFLFGFLFVEFFFRRW